MSHSHFTRLVSFLFIKGREKPALRQDTFFRVFEQEGLVRRNDPQNPKTPIK